MCYTTEHCRCTKLNTYSRVSVVKHFSVIVSCSRHIHAQCTNKNVQLNAILQSVLKETNLHNPHKHVIIIMTPTLRLLGSMMDSRESNWNWPIRHQELIWQQMVKTNVHIIVKLICTSWRQWRNDGVAAASRDGGPSGKGAPGSSRVLN